MQSKRLELRISDELLAKIDEAAMKSWQSRSDYIRESLVLRLNKQDIIDQPNPDDLWQKAIKETLEAPPGLP